MTCSWFQPEIALLVGGELPAARQPAVERHLERCPACRELATALGEDRRVLRSLADEPVDRAVLDRVCARVSAAVVAETSERERRAAASGRRTRALLALAATLGALGLALAVWLSVLRPRPDGPRQADVSAPPPKERSAVDEREAPATSDRSPAEPHGAGAHTAPRAPVPPHGPRPAGAPGPAERSAGRDTEREPPSDRPADRLPDRMAGAATAPERPISPEHAGPASSADDHVAAERETPPITIRIVSDDPDIVFYWLVDEPKEVPNDTAG